MKLELKASARIAQRETSLIEGYVCIIGHNFIDTLIQFDIGISGLILN